MPVTNWNTTTIGGEPFLIIDVAQLRVPLNWTPSSNVFIAVAAPNGINGDAILSYPALVKGDTGDAAALDTAVALNVLDFTDPTADSASFAEIAPGIYKLTMTQRRGPKGNTGVPSIVSPQASDLVGTPVAGKLIAVNAGANGAVYVSEKVGDWYIPATGAVVNAPSGNPGFTIATVAIPAQPNDWRPTAQASTIVTGTGSSLIADLVARLNSSSGNEVGRCFGMAATERLQLTPGPPAGSPDTWDRIAAGVAANVLVRVERQSGTDTFTTSASTTRVRVKADPIP